VSDIDDKWGYKLAAAPYNTAQSPQELTTLQRAKSLLTSIAQMLEEKNRAYGDSASNPLRIFSSCNADEQLRVRIDDKLSRINRGSGDQEDTLRDLIGYLALLHAKQEEKRG